MSNTSQERVRRFALTGAMIGLVLGIGVGVLGFWLTYSRTSKVLGMMLVSMGLPGCVLAGVLIGIVLGQRTPGSGGKDGR